MNKEKFKKNQSKDQFIENRSPINQVVWTFFVAIAVLLSALLYIYEPRKSATASRIVLVNPVVSSSSPLPIRQTASTK